MRSVAHPKPGVQPLQVTVGAAQGLPSVEMGGIVEDRQHFIWIATIGGLVRWDGAQAIVVGGRKWTQRLRQDSVTGLVADPTGGVWAAARTLEFVSDTGEVTDTAIPAVYLAPSKNDLIWIWTPARAQLFDPRTRKVVRSVAHNGVRATVAHPQDVAEVSSSPEGDLGFIDVNGDFHVISRSGDISVYSFSDLTSVGPRAAGGFWVLSGSELVGLDNGQRILTPSRTKALGAHPIGATILELHNGDVLVATFEDGIQRLTRDSQTWDYYPTGIAQQAGVLDHMLQDSRDIVWFSEFGIGVHALMPFTRGAGRWLPDDVDPDTPHRSLDLVLLGDEVWWATDGDGLYALNRVNGSYRVLREARSGAASVQGGSGAGAGAVATGTLPANGVIGLACVEGKIWAGMWGGGIAIVDPKTLTVRCLEGPDAGPLVTNNIFDITTDSDGTVLAAAWGHGVQVLSPQGASLGLVGPRGTIRTQNERPIAIVPSADASVVRHKGRLLIGGWAGLEIVDLTNGSVQRWNSDGGSLRGNIVYSITDGGDGILWLGTSSGLERLDIRRAGAVSTVTDRRGGLPGNQVFTVTPRSDRLLLGTEQGLTVTTNDKTPRVLSVVGQHDGLSADGMARYGHALAPEGTLYLSTEDGLSTLTPDGPRDIPVSVSGLASVEDDKSSAVQGGSLRVTPGEPLKVTLQPLVFWHSATSTTRYRLAEKGDEPWNTVELGPQQISLGTGLTAGTYRLEYQFVDDEGDVVDLSPPVTVVVSPAWYDARRWRTAVWLVAGAAVMLWAYRSRAARVVLERQLALHQNAFDTQQAETNGASREMRNLLHRVSHDLRAPLNNVVGALDLIGSSPPEPSVIERWVAMGKSSGLRLGAMLDDLITHARAETGRGERGRLELVDIRELVDQALGAAGGEQLGIDRSIRRVFGQSRETVITDREWIRQALTNLIGNAIKYSLPGEVLIECEDGPQPNSVRISVSNPCASLTPEQLRELVQPYRRGDAEPESGLGLGLPVAKRLVEQLGGDLVLSSEQGRMRAEILVTDRVSPIRTVLIADDDEISLAQLAAALEGTPYEVRTVSGAQALARAIRELNPDLVVVDHFLGSVAGADVLRDAPDRLGSSWSPRIVGVSSQAQKARAHGRYFVVLDKPVERRLLIDTLRQLDVTNLDLTDHQDGEEKSLAGDAAAAAFWSAAGTVADPVDLISADQTDHKRTDLSVADSHPVNPDAAHP